MGEWDERDKVQMGRVIGVRDREAVERVVQVIWERGMRAWSE